LAEDKQDVTGASIGLDIVSFETSIATTQSKAITTFDDTIGDEKDSHVNSCLAKFYEDQHGLSFNSHLYYYHSFS